MDKEFKQTLKYDLQKIRPAADELLIVRIGTDECPATQENLEDVQNLLLMFGKEDPSLMGNFIVCHHAFDIRKATDEELKVLKAHFIK